MEPKPDLRYVWIEAAAREGRQSCRAVVLDITGRKQAEEQIASLARFPEQNPGPVLRVDASGILLYANRASQKMIDEWGFRVGQPLPKPWHEIVNDVLVSQQKKVIERPCGVRVYSMTLAPFSDAGYVNIYAQDVTERVIDDLALQKARDDLELRVQARTDELLMTNKLLQVEAATRLQAEQTLRLANTYNRGLLETSLDPLMAIGLDGMVSDVNAATELVTGRTRDQLIGTDFYRYFADPDRAVSAYREVLMNGSVRDTELEFRHVDGRSTPVDFNAAVYRDTAGRVIGVFAAARDISQRKQVEQALEVERQQLLVLSQAERNQRLFAEGLAQATAALSSSLDLNEVLDRILDQIELVMPFDAATITLIEDGLVRSARLRGVEQMPESNSEYKDGIPLEAVPELKEIFSTGKPRVFYWNEGEVPFNLFAGWEWVRAYIGVPMQTRKGVIGSLNMLYSQPRDVGEEQIERLSAFASQASIAIQNANLYRELESALAQEHALRTRLIETEKFSAMGRLLGSVAHELNNPLQTIKNCLFLTRQDTLPNSTVNEYVDMAFSETVRLAKLVAQLREVYLPNHENTTQPYVLSKLVDEVHSLLNPHLIHQKVVWEQQPGYDGVMVEVDPDQIKQALINISMNEIDAMQPKGGTLTVELLVSQETNMVGVAIRDTGPGIPPEVVQTLFEPFSTTRSPNPGLGLSICSDLIQNHNGKITVDTRPNQGTTFTIWLPQLNGEAAARQ